MSGSSSCTMGWVSSVTPPVPCYGSLANFTHRDGPKRVDILLRRRGEFIEILCLCVMELVFLVFFGFSVRTLLYERPSTRG